MNRPSIGLCVIAKNEAENLPRLFESVKGCVDKIYLTDTGSTDDTVQVAESLGAEVSHFEWINDFSAARNFNFSQAKTDYILWLDCDDVLGNPEGFNLWRDSVMNIGDYFMAPYWYSLDANGQPTCKFSRERVIKNGLGFKWNYFIHEGILPKSSRGAIRAMPVNSWYVKHLRSSEDLAKDKNRNLKIFESKSESLDARMLYYYGKELFEADKIEESIKEFSKALSNPSLELHDRILGAQYLCYAYMRTEQFTKALELAHTHLMLAPNRAEFHAIIADCYLKLGKLADAVPFFSASKSCILNTQGGLESALFHHKDLYTSYPRNQLSRIYAHLGDIDRAKKEAEECLHIYASEEARAILEELKRISDASVSYKDARDCSDIVISCPGAAPYLWDGDEYRKRAMGGSETAAIEMAEWLHKLSMRPVKVFNERSEQKTVNGVDYIPKEKLLTYFKENKPYLHIAWRHSEKFTDAPTFVWSHDLQTPGVDRVANYNKVMCLTPFHSRFMQATQNVPADKIWVTRNGLNPDKFKDPLGGNWAKDPWKFVFSSSPDRGLDRTMRVLDRVREKYPKVHLHVAYGIEHLPKYGHQKLHDELLKMFEERKDWVKYEGAMQQDELTKLFKKSAYCVQPSDFIETSMISAMERLCCGVYQIMRKVGGVVDTLAPACNAGMAELIDSDCITEAEHDLYAEAVCKAIERTNYTMVQWDSNELSWEKVARSWLEELPKLI